MARFMKVQIRVILPTNNILTIDVEENETFEQFQNKCLQLHGLNLDKEYFNFQNTEIDSDINLSQFINSFNTTDADDQSEIIVYEIRLQPDLENDLNLPIKSENIISTNQVPFINLSVDNLTSENVLNFQNQIFDTQNYNSVSENENNLLTNSLDGRNSYNYMEIESKLREIHDGTKEETITDFCRLCAKHIVCDEKIEIFCNDLISEQIRSYLPIKVLDDDSLPQQICNDCVSNLKMVSDYIQGVREADKVLRLKFLPKKNIEEACVKFEKDTVMLRCRFCQEEISSAEMSLKHSADTHFNKNNLYICVLCEMGYTKYELLENHVKTKHNSCFTRASRTFKYKCKTCSKLFTTLSNLQKHSCLKSKTQQSLHCEICNKSFPTKVRLNFHRQFHLQNARSFFCSECRETFKDESSYFDHVNFSHDPEQIFVCELCEKTFNLRSSFMNHKKVHLEEKSYKCESCQKCFLTHQLLSEHELTHINTKPYQCHLCNKKLIRMSRLRKHLLTHKSDPIVSDVNFCNICKECFQNDDFAKQHKNKHENINCVEILRTDKVFVCEFCEKCFCDTEMLNLHRLEHQGLTPFVCRICQAQFTTYSRFTSHKTTHGIYNNEAKSNPFPVVQHFLCEHCNKSYLQWNHLSLHRKLKHSDNIYKCKDCYFEFPNPWALSQHRKNKHGHHENQPKPNEVLKCEDCGKLFNNVEALQTHQVTQHYAKHKKDFTCQKCGKVFATQFALGTHSRTHNKEYKCSKCSKCFVHLGGLNNHLKLHREPHTICLYCGRKFLSKIECEQHELLHLKKKLICDVCDKSFDTKNQLLEHSQIHEQRPYECQICGLAFRRAFTLQTHMHRHVKSKHSGSFVLMVDMKENEQENLAKTTNLIEENNVPNVSNEVTDNYIDIGNGNLLKVQGNTININGNDYLLVNQNENDQYQMVIDENYSENQQLSENNFSNTIMFVDDNNQLVLNGNQMENQFILAQNNFCEEPSLDISNQFVNDGQNSL